jgi:hypothetical protein
MSDERRAFKTIRLLGIEGKKIDIIPTTKGMNLTEIYNKKFEYLGSIIFDARRRWNRYVLVDLHNDMQMSKDCLDEAFKLTEEYWNKCKPTPPAGGKTK